MLSFNSPRYHIEPLLWIGHIASWVIACLDSVGDDGTGVDVSITIALFFRDDVDDFLSWEFFVLCGFCNECLVGRGADEGCEEFFFFVAVLYIGALVLECVGEAVCLILLYLVIPDEIYQVDDDGDESDKYVVESRIQSRRELKHG